MILPRVPSEPARHRMALWRRLRRAGAIPLGQGVWAVPDLPAAGPLLQELDTLAEEGGGTVLVLTATGHRPVDAAALEADYAAARTDEWAEFLADCGKYLDELAKEHRLSKYTLAELEEEEQSLERLRRWYHDLRARDPLGVTTANRATDASRPTHTLRQCETAFDEYAEQVYRRLGGQR